MKDLATENSFLLLELAAGRGERLFPLVDQPLGHGPSAGVFVFPKGPAGVDEENFQLAPRAAEEQKARGNGDGVLWHRQVRRAFGIHFEAVYGRRRLPQVTGAAKHRPGRWPV